MQSLLESMTGYGEHRAKVGAHHFICRAKSVNHRFLDLKVRIPRSDWSELEVGTRKAAGEAFKRGAVEVTVSIEAAKSTNETAVDAVAAKKFIDAANTLQKKLKLKPEKLTIETLMKMPGVIQTSSTVTEDSLESADFKKILETVVTPALKALKAARYKEGRALLKHLQDMLKDFAAHAAAIGELEGPEKKLAVERMKERIEQTIEILGQKANDASFQQKLSEEASFWIERRDFTEERVRLQMHIEHFSDELKNAKEEGVGRKLEFLQQELLREVNTLGTKAQSPAITQHTIEMKSILEKMKEQLANVS